jgi:hypothetical protein
MSDVARAVDALPPTGSIRDSSAPPRSRVVSPSQQPPSRNARGRPLWLVVEGKTSQYYHADGPSACTSIALTSALQLLRLREKHGQTLGLDCWDPHSWENQLLVDSRLLAAGIRLHNTISDPSTNAHHFAVDEVWKVCALRGQHVRTLACLRASTI